MIKHIYDKDGLTLLRKEEDTPVCGVDFCDTCGDCLACCIEDDCIDARNEGHFWVVCEDKKNS